MRAVRLNPSFVSTVLLIRYGELALKSPPVRREFETALRRNLLAQFLAAGVACRVRSDRGHLYAEVDHPEAAARVACRVFGVTSVSPAEEIPTDRAGIRERLLGMAKELLGPGQSFAIRARRTGRHDFTSQELAAELGAAVLERWPELGLRVDLDDPDRELSVEVRGPRTYLYVERRAGPGGLPLGVAGPVVALVDGPRGGLGAYLMMKRGCRCALVAAGASGAPMAEVLARFDPAVLRRSAEPEAADSTLEAVAGDARAEAVVLPIAVDEFPSARARWGDRPVFSPTVGLSEEEIELRWRAIEELAA